MTAKTAAVDEVAEILQTPGEIVIDGDLECVVRRLRTREFFSLMNVLLRGLGGQLQVIFDSEDVEDKAAFAGRLTGAIMSAIPYAEDEVITFLRRMVEPKDRNKKTVNRWSEIMSNPSLDDLFVIVSKIVEQEADEMAQLGKAARSWWATMGPSIQERIAGQ